MSALQINSAFCDGEADKGLIQSYIKWKAIMAAKDKAQVLCSISQIQLHLCLHPRCSADA